MTFRGSLEQLPLPDVLQLVTNSGKTGRVDLVHDQDTGQIFVRAGQIVHASHRSADGEAAIYELVGWARGRFTFVPDAPASLDAPGSREYLRDFETLPGDSGASAPVTISKSNVNLLLEAALRSDELRRLERDLATSDRVPQLLEPSGGVTFTAPQWTLVRAMDGQRSLKELAYALNWSLLDVYRTFESLKQAGLAELRPLPPAPTRLRVAARRARAHFARTTIAEDLLAEETQDRRRLSLAVLPAIVLHLGVLATAELTGIPGRWWQVPALEEGRPRLYVLQPLRFRMPPPEPGIEIPKLRAKKVPIPDPDPDLPEPLRDIAPEEYIESGGVELEPVIPPSPPATRGDSDGPIYVTGDVRRPEKLQAPSPQYTEAARRAGIEGRVVLRAIIDRSGSVTDLEVLSGLPYGLTEAAVDAAKRWRFRPATLDGRPVAVYFNLTVFFALDQQQ